jgi:hypothetical protein
VARLQRFFNFVAIVQITEWILGSVAEDDGGWDGLGA